MQPSDLPIDVDALLTEATRQILRHEDPVRLTQWLTSSLRSFMEPGMRAGSSPENTAPLASALARAIWNATPLPGNQFRPAPLPAPGRNDPCPCGSGLKFKRCCAGAPAMTEINRDLMWSYLLDALPPARAGEAAAAKQIPAAVLAEYAADLLADGEAGDAVELLMPLFESVPLNTLRADVYGFALDVLMNALDEVDQHDRKLELIDRVTKEASRSPLRAAAWQRLATIRSDAGDSAGAWQAFKTAQRDDPESLALANLEILLLLADGRVDEVPERARHWIRRFRRAGVPDDDVVIEWLRDAEENPSGILGDPAIMDDGDEGQALREWIRSVQQRPLPHYRYCEDPPPARPDDELPPDARTGQLALSFDDGDAVVHEIDGEDDVAVPPHVHHLVAPSELHAVERGWHDVFTLPKPFLAPLQVYDDEGWIWEDEEEWCEYLRAHPEAFDSLHILDDLANAALDHPLQGTRPFDADVLEPLLERAVAIVEHAVSGHPDARLSWRLAQNRPALRALDHLATQEVEKGNRSRGVALAALAIALDPEDQQEFRALLMEQYLRCGRERDAADLAAAYPDDRLAETTWGRVLALYRLEEPDAALDALRDAQALLPRVHAYLVRERVREPEHEAIGVAIGGDDQAWSYRVEMRDEWKRTPGILAWLEKHPPQSGPDPD